MNVGNGRGFLLGESSIKRQPAQVMLTIMRDDANKGEYGRVKMTNKTLV